MLSAVCSTRPTRRRISLQDWSCWISGRVRASPLLRLVPFERRVFEHCGHGEYMAKRALDEGHDISFPLAAPALSPARLGQRLIALPSALCPLPSAFCPRSSVRVFRCSSASFLPFLHCWPDEPLPLGLIGCNPVHMHHGKLVLQPRNCESDGQFLLALLSFLIPGRGLLVVFVLMLGPLPFPLRNDAP
jgi:hypothetical protein